MVDATQLLGWGGVGWGGLGMMTFFGLEHMVDAAQLLGWGGKTHRSLRKQKKGLRDMSRAKKKRVRVRHGQRSGLQRCCFSVACIYPRCFSQFFAHVFGE